MPWVTAKHAADLMDIHLTTVLRQARAGKLVTRSVPSRSRAGKNLIEVEVASLSDAARTRWCSLPRLRHIPPPIAPPPAAEALVPAAAPVKPTETSAGLSAQKLAWAQFRYGIISPLVTGGWEREHESRMASIAAICAREHVAPNAVAKRYSPAGVLRMLRRFREDGMAGLANDTRSDKGESRALSQPMRDYIAAAYCSGGSGQFPALRSIREVARLVAEERARRAKLHRDGGLMDYIRAGFREFVGMPTADYLFGAASYGTIARFIAALPDPLKTLARRGESDFDAKCLPYIMRDYAAIRPMDWVVFDHRRCDIFVLHRKAGRLVLMRPWETVALDMKSRAVLASIMCESPSALSVGSCIREIILRYGLFSHAYLDNGKEFTASYIDDRGPRQGEAWRQDVDGAEFASMRGIFGQLGINVVHAAPYNAKAKLIEPSFRNPAYFERTLAGACGNRPPNRPEWLEQWEREFRRWNPETQPANHPFHAYEEFRRLKAHYYVNDYGNRPHSGKAMEGRTPNQVMKEEYLDLGMARMVSPRALDLLMQRRRVRKVQHGGTLVCAFGGQDYVYTHPALFAQQGREIETAYDPYQIGEMVCYEPGGDYICVATSQPLYGMGEREISEPLKERRKLAREVRKSLREIQRYATLPTPMERMEFQQSRLASVGTAASTPQTSATLPARYERASAAIAGNAALALPAPDEEDEVLFLGSV